MKTSISSDSFEVKVIIPLVANNLYNSKALLSLRASTSVKEDRHADTIITLYKVLLSGRLLCLAWHDLWVAICAQPLLKCEKEHMHLHKNN